MTSYQFELPCFNESDGKLGTFKPKIIPGFQVNRIFYIFEVPEDEERASHVCMNSSIAFIVLAGNVTLSVETEEGINEYTLGNKTTAVFAPSGSWIRAYNFSKDAVLVGMSDRKYSDCQYEKDYGRYKEIIRGKTK